MSSLRPLTPLLAVLLTSAALVPLRGAVEITETEDAGMAAFRIETPAAVYFYQKEAGGFSSILDRDGNDWLSWRRSEGERYPDSAASDYRGLPNMVFRSDDGGAGHPGFFQCVTIQVDADTLRSFSRSGKWQWSWDFTEDEAILTVEQVDPDHAYWFLYEGPIAGRFAPSEQYWGHNEAGPLREFPDYVKTGGIFGQWTWAYFGSEAVDRILLLRHLTPDGLPDTMGYMGNTRDGLDSPDGMVVFGFGRYERATPLMSAVPNRFSVAFREVAIRTEEDHAALAASIAP